MKPRPAVAASRCAYRVEHPDSFTSMISRARRLRPEMLTSEQALEQAKALARAERETGG